MRHNTRRKILQKAVESSVTTEKPLEALVCMKARCPCGKRVTKLMPREHVGETAMKVLPQNGQFVSAVDREKRSITYGPHLQTDCETKLVRTDDDGNEVPDAYDYIPPKKKGKDYGKGKRSEEAEGRGSSDDRGDGGDPGRPEGGGRGLLGRLLGRKG